MAPRKALGSRAGERGKLRIGDDWNAITIIALSQSNPLKAIAELVENFPGFPDGISGFNLGDFHLSFGDQRPCQGCPEKILTFIDGICPERRKHIIPYKGFGQIFHIRFGGARLKRVFPDLIQIFILNHSILSSVLFLFLRMMLKNPRQRSLSR